MVFRIPDIDQRTAIVGRTGSGKTQGGSFILSQMPFDQQPFVIIDFKREKLFQEIPGIRSLPLEMPRQGYPELNQPGLFIMRANPGEEDLVDEFFWYVLDHENCGIFIDEGYMVGKSKALIALLTQGRSKHIPMIICSQRPRHVTPFAFSEADYLMVFRLNNPDDRKAVGEHVDADIRKRLKPYHSYWYDVAQDQLVILRPVPDREWIKNAINRKIDAIETRHNQKQFV